MKNGLYACVFVALSGCFASVDDESDAKPASHVVVKPAGALCARETAALPPGCRAICSESSGLVTEVICGGGE